MGDGWIKLHRKLLKSAVSQDPIVGHVWVQLLLNANWEHRQLLDGTFLEPGDLVIGQHKFAAEIGVSRHQLRRALLILEKLGNTASKAASKGTHVSICNWGAYQDGDEASGQESGQRAASERPDDGQRAASERPQNKKERSKEGKEGKEVKKRPSQYSKAFLGFWEVFALRRRAKKADAWRAWQQMGCEVISELVTEGAVAYAASPEGLGEYCVGPPPWLRGARWEDDRASWQQGEGESSQVDTTRQEIQKADIEQRKQQRAASQPTPFREMP